MIRQIIPQVPGHRGALILLPDMDIAYRTDGTTMVWAIVGEKPFIVTVSDHAVPVTVASPQLHTCSLSTALDAVVHIEREDGALVAEVQVQEVQA